MHLDIKKKSTWQQREFNSLNLSSLLMHVQLTAQGYPFNVLLREFNFLLTLCDFTMFNISATSSSITSWIALAKVQGKKNVPPASGSKSANAWIGMDLGFYCGWWSERIFPLLLLTIFFHYREQTTCTNGLCSKVIRLSLGYSADMCFDLLRLHLQFSPFTSFTQAWIF